MDAVLLRATPLPGFLLELKFLNGSTAIVNLARRVQTVRFAGLAAWEMFSTARAEGDRVVWSDGKREIGVFCGELLDAMMMD